MSRVFALALAFAGALVGAGFASGREIIWFFSAFGVWSWLGIFVAAAICAFLIGKLLELARVYNTGSIGELCERVLGGVGGRIFGSLFALLMLVTASAMLAASGEIATVLFGRAAYMPALCVTAVAGAFIAGKGLGALAKAGAWVLPLTLGLFFIMIFVPGRSGVARQPIHWAVLFGMIYSAMNVAAAGGIICEAGVSLTKREARVAAIMCGGEFLILLLLANISLGRHAGGLLEEAIPTITLGKWWGPAGLLFTGVVLWMAILTTISTALHTLHIQLESYAVFKKDSILSLVIAVCTAFAVALIGFSKLVDVGYTALGFISIVMLAAVVIRGKKSLKLPRCSR